MGTERAKKATEALIDAKQAFVNAQIAGYAPEDVRSLAISFLIQAEKGNRGNYAPTSAPAPTTASIPPCPVCKASMKKSQNGQYYNCVNTKMVQVDGKWVNQGCKGYLKI